MSIKLMPSALALSAVLVAASAAFATTTTTNLNVTATVLDTCVVTSGGALTFASVNTTAASNEVVPGNIAIVCTASRTGLTVTLGAGANASGGQRRMSDSTTNRLPYTIYSDAGHSSAVAIDGQIYSGAITAAVPLAIPVYGQVPAGNYSAGVYSDTVLVTLVY